nr:MAG TPA: hypothetical protein [Caudoviricetes sp.]
MYKNTPINSIIQKFMHDSNGSVLFIVYILTYTISSV